VHSNNPVNSWRLLAAAVAMIAAPALVISAPLTQSLDVRAPARPAMVRSNGATLLLYELHITNFSSRPLGVRRIAVIDARDGQLLDAIEGERLKAVRRSIATPADPDEGMLPPGMSAVIYIEMKFEAGHQLPARLRHQLEYERDDALLTTVAAPIEVGDRTAVILGPPLRGGPWAAVYDPLLDRGHRRAFYAIDGAARIPGRFAIDWFKLNSRGRMHAGEAADENEWFGYGEPVLAVADGVSAAVRDGVPERGARSTGSGRDLNEGSGNFVVLNLGNGQFAFYEHLKPGSIVVKQGDRVKRGDVIAALGNTGDTAGPHLHFHVADASFTLAAEGLPFVFERFTLIGRYESIWAAFKGEPWRASAAPPPVIERELPAANVVVSFPVE
jgi:murein DD-endopeptidase MepM/ murein hydrolase activator NlpD